MSVFDFLGLDLSKVVVFLYQIFGVSISGEYLQAYLTYLDKVLILVVWLLFQSPYSGWMISTKAFGKLKVLLPDLRENS